MAVLDKDSFLESIKKRIGDDTSDEALEFIENLTDTYTSMEEKSNEDWKSKYEDSEKSWREKYKQRFFTSDDTETETETSTEEEENETNKVKTFDELFD